MAKVKLPIQINEHELELKVGSISELINFLERTYPNRIVIDGKLNKFLNLYVNGVDYRLLDHEKLKETDEVIIFPAIAGG